MDLIEKSAFLELSKNKFQDSNLYLDKLRNLSLKYILVKNFFGNDELEKIKKDLLNLPQPFFTIAASGYKVFPRTSFSTSIENEDPSIYFGSTKESISNINKYFSSNLIDEFFQIFSKLSAKKTGVLYGPSIESTFTPFNFRIMNPKVGKNATSQIHNGSFLTKRCLDTSFRHLINEIDFDNQLSFFALIQNSDEGGEITIYDFPRKDFPEIKDFRYLLDGDRLIDLEKTDNKFEVKMEEGDLIIFPGGQLWHRVEPVLKGERITLGGFLASDIKNEKWYYWI